MFCLTKPAPGAIASFLAAERTLRYSYPEVGATREHAPAGYSVDHNRVLLGKRRDAFERAKIAIRQWKMFEMPWVQLCWPDVPIETNATVAVLIRHLGFWSMNSARIVYVLDTQGEVERYGFAYGTLPGHAENGEERFSVEYHAKDQSVWYDIYAFSRPGFLATLGYPMARALQSRFVRDSKSAMKRAVESTG
jgi:uncharacterized protein (UPF0548 family)